MYPQELEDLLKEYLTDGIITAKEREILIKKAESLEVNPDEFDLYIDAQLQKLDQEVDAAARKRRGRSCPYCGGVIQMLTEKCPHCGEYISLEGEETFKSLVNKANESLKVMAEHSDGSERDEYEKALVVVESSLRELELYYSNNPKVKFLSQKIEQEKVRIQKVLQKADAADKREDIIFWCILIALAIFAAIGYFLSK